MLYIDKINDTHIDEVYEIFNNSISPSWSVESIKAELKSGKNISLVCLLDSKPIGFLLSSYVLDECDLTNGRCGNLLYGGQHQRDGGR